MSVVGARPGHASAYLVRAAVTAPSVHNSQPWLFVSDGDRGIEVHADAGRRLPLADPHGREMLISCGAALFNVRLAMRHLGFKPVVRDFPEPGDPSFLARVMWGAYAPPTGEEQRLYGALHRRHTVRGPLLADPLPAGLLDALRDHARAEGAELHVVGDPGGRRRLAALVRAGEEAQHPDCLPLTGRDYAGLAPLFPAPPRRGQGRSGLVAILGTDRDDRRAWLRVGQALERVLLHAAAHDVMAAFHTQPLEVPHLRARTRRTVGEGAFPQMILRLGHASGVCPLPRRPLAEVLR
ncbi:hypothetical protein BU52_26295 [Streptomyces toyocaensis]|uniref:Nitroreductase n=1 Tax=Streptomyces toyocaensis TaxID=55952 RepID=A0A081XLA0_STRTO|nr:hypothetical protein [Streptomyces toyocaensis]KES04323.1 hypothetical protein BU52_26295 [Streptomyces toyocaensis]